MEQEQLPVNKFPNASSYDYYARPDLSSDMGQLSSTYSASIFFRRWAATIIDFVLIALTTGAVYFVTGDNYGLLFLVPLLLLCCYYVLLEGLTGYTAGKFAVRIKAVNEFGDAPGVLKGLIRTLARLIEINPFLFGGLPAGITVLATKKHQRIGDMIARTYVVKVKDLPPPSKKTFVAMTIAIPVYAVLVIVLTALGLRTIDFEASNEPKHFVTADGQFQLTTASSWSEDSTLNDEADISISNGFSEKYLVLFTESKTDFDETVTLEDYFGYAQEESQQLALTDSIIEPAGQTSIGGNPAYQFSFKGEADGVKIYYVVTTIDTGEHFHKIYAWTLASKYDDLQAELHEVSASLTELTP